MQTECHTVKNTIHRYRSFRYALILEGIAVGAISGAFVVLFRYLLTYAEKLLNTVLNYGKDHIWVIPVWFVFLTAAAFVVAMLLKWESFISGSGIPQVEGEMMGELDPCWWRVLIAKNGRRSSFHWMRSVTWEGGAKYPAGCNGCKGLVASDQKSQNRGEASNYMRRQRRTFCCI